MANTFKGRVWKFGDDINTDLVIPNFAVLMTVEEQLPHCFSANRPGWVDEVQPGDVLVAGRNFGVGSARNIGAIFHGLGISGVVADRSTGFGLRNCINSGLPSLAVPRRPRTPSTRATSRRSIGPTGRRAERHEGHDTEGNPIPKALQDIVHAGGVEEMLRNEGYLAKR